MSHRDREKLREKEKMKYQQAIYVRGWWGAAMTSKTRASIYNRAVLVLGAIGFTLAPYGHGTLVLSALFPLLFIAIILCAIYTVSTYYENRAFIINLAILELWGVVACRLSLARPTLAAIGLLWVLFIVIPAFLLIALEE